MAIPDLNLKSAMFFGLTFIVSKKIEWATGMPARFNSK